VGFCASIVALFAAHASTVTPPPESSPSPAVVACDPARYYILLFGGLAVETAHTWATWVKVTPQPDGSQHLESFTISWLPKTLKVRPWAVHPEPGRNLTLDETLDYMKTGSHDLSLWGPYEIRGRWYEQAAAYKATLDSGAVRFRTLDRGEKRPDVNHCVHAVAKTDLALMADVQPVLWYGEPITRKLAESMVRVGVVADPHTTHDWIVSALGLDYDRNHLKRQQVGEPVRRFHR
jgi:hypothetical protein